MAENQSSSLLSSARETRELLTDPNWTQIFFEYHVDGLILQQKETKEQALASKEAHLEVAAHVPLTPATDAPPTLKSPPTSDLHFKL